MKYTLKSKNIYLENEVVSGSIDIANGIIRRINRGSENSNENIIDLKNLKYFLVF